MKIRALDDNGDFTFGNNQNNYLQGLPQLKQNLITRIRSYKNDWFLDEEANIDWINLLGQKNNEDLIKQELRKVILTTYGVTAINSLDFVYNNEIRRAEINIQLKTIYDDDVSIGLEV